MLHLFLGLRLILFPVGLVGSSLVWMLSTDSVSLFSIVTML